MKIILKEDVAKLGSKDQVVEVSDGYARNFLLPRKLAVIADAGQRKKANELKQTEARHVAKEIEEAKHLAEKIGKIVCTIKAKAGESDKLFGSVTSQDIAQALEKDGLSIDKRKIEIEKSIKELGTYQVPIKVAEEITAQLKIIVVKEE